MQILKNEKEFDEFIKNNNFVVVDFFANWCGPCKMMSPNLEEVQNDKDYQDVKIVKVDVDENMELANRYQIYSIPALYFFKGGNLKEVHKSIGYCTVDEIKVEINKARG